MFHLFSSLQQNFCFEARNPSLVFVIVRSNKIPRTSTSLNATLTRAVTSISQQYVQAFTSSETFLHAVLYLMEKSKEM